MPFMLTIFHAWFELGLLPPSDSKRKLLPLEYPWTTLHFTPSSSQNILNVLANPSQTAVPLRRTEMKSCGGMLPLRYAGPSYSIVSAMKSCAIFTCMNSSPVAARIVETTDLT